MKYLWSLLALALMASAVYGDDDAIEEENGVLVLTTKNFKKAIDDNEHILVEFYAPWCGHCKALAPEYEKAAEKLKASGSKIRLAKVDATIEKELGDEHGVQGFPTLKFFKKGDKRDYNGPRESEGIVNWLEKKTGPPAKDLKTVEDATELTEDKDVVLIGFFKDQDSEGAKEFLKAADSNDDQAFGITSAQAVYDKYEVKKDGIVLIKNFDEGRNDYDGDLKAKDINTFAKTNSLPLVSEFSPETAAKIFGTDVKVHLLLLAPKDSKDYDKWIDALKPVAKANKGKMIFVLLDSSVEDNKQILDFFGLKPEDCPDYLIYEMESSSKYVAGAKSITEKEVSKFVSDYFDGKLKKTLKSEDLPEDWDKNPVKVLVSSNFKEVALNKKKDVFVEFYAPWCGHCKSLAPKWDQLAEHFKDSDDIIIAKMDSTANEIEEVQVQGFPTLKMFKKETNEIVDYNGPRELENLIKFVETGDATIEDDDDDDEDDDDDDDKDKKRKEEL